MDAHPGWRGMTVAQLRAALINRVMYASPEVLHALTHALEAPTVPEARVEEPAAASATRDAQVLAWRPRRSP